MASPNACWGVEIGAGAIKALKVELDGDNWVVADYAVINHPKVLSTPDLDQEDVLRVSLGALVSQKDLSDARVAVSVPGHQSFARFAKLPPVEPKKVPDIVKFEAVQQIPFPLDDVEWDYQTFVSPDSPDVEVGIFAITRPRIMEKLQLLNDVGITPDFATLSPVAAYNALAADLEFTEDTPGTIIVDIGTTATDIVCADAGRVWVRTFPIGGHQFTDALVTSFKLSYPKAERLKREAEQTKHARHVFQAMRPVFTDLVQEIQRSIGGYQNGHPGAELKRVIGLGSTFQLPGLKRYLRQQLGMDTYRIEQFKKLRVDPAVETEFNAVASNMATAYGLAIQGLGLGTLNANLMPVPVIREALWKRKRAWFGVAAGLAAAAGASMFVRPVLDQSAITSAERPAVIDRAIREASNVKREADDLGVTGGDQGDTTASSLVALLEGRSVYPHVAADISHLFAAAAEYGLENGELVDGRPAFELVAMDATYAQPEQARGGARGGRFNQPPAGAGQGEEAGPETFERIQVTIDISVPLPAGAARELARSVIEEWFESHAEREGMPYRIMKTEDFLTDGAAIAAGAGPQRTTRNLRAGPQRRINQGFTVIPAPGTDPQAGAGGAPARPRSDDQFVNQMNAIAPIQDPATATAQGGTQPSRQEETALSIALSFVLGQDGGDS